MLFDFAFDFTIRTECLKRYESFKRLILYVAFNLLGRINGVGS